MTDLILAGYIATLSSARQTAVALHMYSSVVCVEISYKTLDSGFIEQLPSLSRFGPDGDPTTDKELSCPIHQRLSLESFCPLNHQVDA